MVLKTQKKKMKKKKAVLSVTSFYSSGFLASPWNQE